MGNIAKIEATIFKVIDEVNNILSKDQILEKSRETVLLGHNSKLDSIGLINFIISLEQKIEEDFNTKVSLMTDLHEEKGTTNLANVGSLIEQINTLLKRGRYGD